MGPNRRGGGREGRKKDKEETGAESGTSKVPEKTNGVPWRLQGATTAAQSPFEPCSSPLPCSKIQGQILSPASQQPVLILPPSPRTRKHQHKPILQAQPTLRIAQSHD
ncbi:Hypothetical predicted protein [Podarcis lilfordi]|uniref:Uncharacterized protein n=1 Tax=Podarcis lilfordi TaxID=74358 RepID=A0AA35KSN2_9SAUR|nr:Hypothetical predicted protein [Podarcis lilfordi]